MTARRFEFRDIKSAKFWQIEAVDHRTITTWGRMGTDGQTKAKEFASAAKATADVAKKIAEKTKKGYTEIGEVVGASPPPLPPKTPAPETPSATPPPTPEAAPPSAAVESSSEVVLAEPPSTDNPEVDSPRSLAAVIPVPEPAADRFVNNPAWQHFVLPRRDRPSSIFELSPEANPATAATILSYLVEYRRSTIKRLLDASGLDERLIALVLAGPLDPDPTDPLHVVAHGLAVHLTKERSSDSNVHHVVDYWVDTAGLEFALRAGEESFWWQLPDQHRTTTRTPVLVLGRRAPSFENALFLPAIPKRIRQHLARASDADYAAARQVGEELRTQDLSTAIRMAYMFPSEIEWVEEIIDHAVTTKQRSAERMLVMSSTTDQLERVLGLMQRTPQMNRWTPDNIPTLLATFGAELTPFLGRWMTGQVIAGGPVDADSDAETRKAYAEALRRVGTDEAMGELANMADHKHVLPTLTEFAMDRPHAAIRVLTPRASGTSTQAKAVAALLQKVVRENLGAAVAMLPQLSDSAVELVEQLADRSDERPSAPDELMHQVLVNPPWENRTIQSERVVIKELTMISPAPRVSLAGATPDPTTTLHPHDTPADWAVATKAMLAGNGTGMTPTRFFAVAPIAVVESMTTDWQLPSGANRWITQRVADILITRLGPAAMPALESLTETNLADVFDLVEPLASARLAMPFADAYERMKLLRSRAGQWLLSNADIAAYGLIPVAVGADSADQRTATNALRYIARSDRATLDAAAAEYGEPIQAAIADLLEFNELQVLPKRMPKSPDFVSLSSMPLPLLADRQHQLSPSAANNLLLMVAIGKPDAPYPGIDVVLPTLDPASTAAFAWDVFEAWRAAGMASKQSWALTAQGLLGDDETVRQLTPLIRAWPGEGGHKRAVNGLDVLANIGTDMALMQLFSMSRKLKFKGLKTKAAEKVQQIAEQRGLTADELADRLVPDLDLDANGSLTLDYGARTFTVGFDEQLKPFVRDDTGKMRKALPKPGQKDDAERAPLAYKQFSALKKDARAVAADQLIRLEQAMVKQRRWTQDQFTEYFISHPLIIHLVRRLVWGVYVGGQLVSSFRVAEDGSLAGANDDAFELADEATVGIVHPLEMDPAALATWGEVLSDYEMLQPFQQISRETFAMTPAELAEPHFTRFVGPSLPFGKYLGLEKRGWVRGIPQDAGICPNLYRTLPDGNAVHLELEQGLWTGYIQETPDQPISGVWISTPTSSWYRQGQSQSPAFSTLDPVTISELLRDLVDLFG